MSQQSSNDPTPQKPEKELSDSIWKHPYFLYVLLTIVLFLLLLFIGWLGLENGWIPNRGINPR